MKSTRAVFAACALAVLATGCATVPRAAPELDLAAKRFDPPPADRAHVYLYRNESFGAAVKMPVMLNGQWVGDTAAKTFLLLPVAPGAHTLLSKTENDATLSLATQGGKSYFVWQEVKMGLLSARSALHLVEEKEGREGVLECSLAQGAPR
jgi:uncharacterized protein DUF2846